MSVKTENLTTTQTAVTAVALVVTTVFVPKLITYGAFTVADRMRTARLRKALANPVVHNITSL